MWTRPSSKGRIDYPSLFRQTWPGARRIEVEDDVRDVIEHMRLTTSMWFPATGSRRGRPPEMTELWREALAEYECEPALV